MEINSLRSYYNNVSRHNARAGKSAGAEIETANPVASSSQTAEQDASNLDFSSMSPRALREVARVKLEDGLIDQETFATISEGLPMEAIDVSGRIIDLSGITDDTAFDFRDYYENQLEIAVSLGDARTANTLQSVMAFINNARI